MSRSSEPRCPLQPGIVVREYWIERGQPLWWTQSFSTRPTIGQRETCPLFQRGTGIGTLKPNRTIGGFVLTFALIQAIFAF